MLFVFSSRCRYFLGYISEEFDNSDRPNSRQRLDEADAIVNSVTATAAPAADVEEDSDESETSFVDLAS